MRCSLSLPLDLIESADVAALCAELTRLDLPGLVDLVEREACRAGQEGERMRRIEIPVEYDFAVLTTAVQDDWKARCRAKEAEYARCQPVLAAFFASYADVISGVQQRERDALAWFAAQLDGPCTAA